MTYRDAVAQFRRDYWRAALQTAGGRVREAAIAAGVRRTDAYTTLKRLGLNYRRLGYRYGKPGNWDRPLPP